MCACVESRLMSHSVKKSRAYNHDCELFTQTTNSNRMLTYELLKGAI